MATPSNSPQCIWLVRYGLTEFPLVENTGPYDSDIDPKEGILHAQAIADRIASSANAPTQVYTSPFLRCVHTAHIIANAASSKVLVEEGLTEWQVKSLLVEEANGKTTHPKSAQVHAKSFDAIDPSYQSLNVVGGSGELVDEESEEQLVDRCAKTLDKILGHAGGKSIAIVSHAPCDIAMALGLSGKSLEEAKKEKANFPPWPLGGLTLFKREKGSTDWKMELYGDSNHMPGDYQKGLKRWTLPSLN